MTFEIVPNHVAILVPSIRKAAAFLKQFDFEIGKEEIWEGEGTKGIYVGHDKNKSLLLIEPIQPGAYQRAIEKRGPGLHHLAIDVLNLEGYIESYVKPSEPQTELSFAGRRIQLTDLF